MAKRKGRKQCAVKGCRKLQEIGSAYCRYHKEDTPDLELVKGEMLGDPELKDIQKLTRSELSRFTILDLKQNANIQKLQILNYKRAEVQQRFEEAKRALKEQLTTIQSQIEAVAHETKNHERVYVEFCDTLSEKYNVPRKYLVVNDENGVIHDIRKKQKHENEKIDDENTKSKG